jgi:hypothetical protein
VHLISSKNIILFILKFGITLLYKDSVLSCLYKIKYTVRSHNIKDKKLILYIKIFIFLIIQVEAANLCIFSSNFTQMSLLNYMKVPNGFYLP